jgi:uncharacterized membrane protein YdfJ with MMPL/SSD domain
MHILLRYYESKCNTREERVKDALGTLGISILIGGLSTFLGVLPLAFSSSAILRTVFTAFFALVTLGLTHGLILLPVILSIWGPNVGSSEQESGIKQKGSTVEGPNDLSLSARNLYSIPLGFTATDDGDRTHVLVDGTNIKVRIDSLVEC